MYTFGFEWAPWEDVCAVADGEKILGYLKQVSRRHGIEGRIRFGRVVRWLEWDSGDGRWRVVTRRHKDNNDKEEKEDDEEEEEEIFTAQFIFLGTGLFDYDQPQPVSIPNLTNFQGPVLHPQFWPETLSYTDKRIVIIGSGSTAITLLPALTQHAEHVTMLQRSPGYYHSIPERDGVDEFIRRWFPGSWAYRFLRWKYILGFIFMYQIAVLFPGFTKRQLRGKTEAQLPGHIPIEPHFVPGYNPWEQRLLVTPGGDFFRALRSGRADVVTGVIETVDEKGVVLKSGQRVDADIIVTATGLRMVVLGKIGIRVDGVEIDHSTKFAWRGSWVQDVPNLAFAFGYTNSSWTLGADVSMGVFIRVVREVLRREKRFAVPRLEKPEEVTEVPWLNLNSNYIQKAAREGRLPKAGDVAPWKPRTNYIHEELVNRWGDVTGGLAFG